VSGRLAPLRNARLWAVLWCWNVIWAVEHYRGAGGSWHYFALGGRLLFGDDQGEGLQLYAAHPELQIGPISFLVARPLHLLDPWHGRAAGVILMSLTGPLVLAVIWRLVPEPARRPERLLIAGLIFLPIWAELATHTGHLDDILALFFGLAAIHARLHRHPVLAGLVVAAAADSKPWALAFLPLLLIRPARSTWAALAACAAGLAVAWLPFLLLDPHTLQAAHFTIKNATSSGLRVLGYSGPNTPAWDRPAQLALGCLLGALAVYRRRWEAVILLATASRILLDPEVYGYYTSGVLVGTLIFDLVATRRRWPLVTLTAALTLYLSRFVATVHLLPLTPAELGQLRVAFVLVAVAAAFAASRARSSGRHRISQLRSARSPSAPNS
jgi:Glycosyltransferase family 87